MSMPVAFEIKILKCFVPTMNINTYNMNFRCLTDKTLNFTHQKRFQHEINNNFEYFQISVTYSNMAALPTFTGCQDNARGGNYGRYFFLPLIEYSSVWLPASSNSYCLKTETK